jgi:hypothetical protein
MLNEKGGVIARERMELLRLFEAGKISQWELRKRRLELVPLEAIPEALERDRRGLALTDQQYCASHLGFMSGEVPVRRATECSKGL